LIVPFSYLLTTQGLIVYRENNTVVFGFVFFFIGGIDIMKEAS